MHESQVGFPSPPRVRCPAVERSLRERWSWSSRPCKNAGVPSPIFIRTSQPKGHPHPVLSRSTSGISVTVTNQVPANRVRSATASSDVGKRLIEGRWSAYIQVFRVALPAPFDEYVVALDHVWQGAGEMARFALGGATCCRGGVCPENTVNVWKRVMRLVKSVCEPLGN